MKIAFVNMFYHPTFGGVEVVMKELAERFVKKGHEVHVFCCDSDKNNLIPVKEETINGVKVHRLPYWFRLSLSTFIWPSLLWNKILWKERFDIIHSQVSGHAYILFSGILARLRGMKHIHTTHCPWTDAFRPLSIRIILFFTYLIFNKLAFKLCDKIVAITPWEVDSYLKRWTSDDKIKIIRNGMDSILLRKIKNNNFRKKYNIKTKYLVLYFGRLNFTKGPDKLALAAKELVKERKDITVLFVGPDEGAAETVKEIIKGEERVKYIGPIRGKDKVAEMYQAADVYVLPSYREGLPLTLFEAFASGLPVVASPVNGIPYEMKEFENGLFVDYGDLRGLKKAIIKILDNKELSKKMSKNNYEKAKNYDWDHIADEYLELYKEVLKE